MNSRPFSTSLSSIRGFSLIEVLLAVFILGIGLIMVASLFPVGANWTRQATEDSVAQNIAINAVSIIKGAYAPNSLNTATAGKFGAAGGLTVNVSGLPKFTDGIPIGERTYQFGGSSPFPASNPLVCTYYWTALGRLIPGQSVGGSQSYAIYVLVFHKGDAIHTFYQPPATANSSYSEVVNTRDITDVITSYPTNYHYLEPALISGSYSLGTFNSSKSPASGDCVPPIGDFGIGISSGTVFRQTVDLADSKVNPRPLLKGQSSESIGTVGENIIFAPPADGTTASPLVYVYQTTLSF